MTTRVHCATCGSWQRQALDYGHCWSGDRLTGDFTHGPADLTYPDMLCEAWWQGSFDPAEIVAAGGNPEVDYGDPANEAFRSPSREIAE